LDRSCSSGDLSGEQQTRKNTRGAQLISEGGTEKKQREAGKGEFGVGWGGGVLSNKLQAPKKESSRSGLLTAKEAKNTVA